jgi:hypothetical protein
MLYKLSLKLLSSVVDPEIFRILSQVDKKKERRFYVPKGGRTPTPGSFRYTKIISVQFRRNIFSLWFTYRKKSGICLIFSNPMQCPVDVLCSIYKRTAGRRKSWRGVLRWPPDPSSNFLPHLKKESSYGHDIMW